MSCLSLKQAEMNKFLQQYRYESETKKPAVNHNLPHEVDQCFKQLTKLEDVKRECLKCEQEFIAEGRYNRICFRCKPKTFKQPWEQDGM
tara:strand:- start:5174 stop:5440 length:267 start_codon:yes stop_codon:yes gene_type:complete